MWTADIHLKTGKNVIVEDLQSINEVKVFDSSITKIVKFEDFHLLNGQHLTFVGKSSVVTFMSGEIAYVEFSQ